LLTIEIALDFQVCRTYRQIRWFLYVSVHFVR